MTRLDIEQGRLDALLDVLAEIAAEREFIRTDSEYDRGRVACLTTVEGILADLLRGDVT